MFGWFKRTHPDPVSVRRWRDAVTAAARSPEPYLREWVPDTIYGRFHMVALVATLALRRLKACGAAGRAISKDFAELLFSDFDHALREHGVGDSSIARRIRKMGEEFYGLAGAVDKALDEGGGDKALADVIQRHVQADLGKAQELAVFVRDMDVKIERLSDDTVLKGPETLS